jgi:hypothetical protein
MSDVFRDEAGNPITEPRRPPPKGPPPKGDKPADPVRLAAAHVFGAVYAVMVEGDCLTTAPDVASAAADAYVEWFKSGGQS